MTTMTTRCMMLPSRILFGYHIYCTGAAFFFPWGFDWAYLIPQSMWVMGTV